MNAIIPKAPRAGERLSAAQMQQVVAAIRRFMPIAGVGVRVSYTQGGTVIHANPSKGGGGSAPSKLPWTFKCVKSTDPATGDEIRTGGWTNCRCQIGLDIDWGSADVKNVEVDWENLSDEAKDQLTSAHVILGTNLCADGIYFLYVELANKLVDHDAAKIVNSADPNYDSYHTDTTAGTFLIQIGTVENGSLWAGAPHINPVIYKYL